MGPIAETDDKELVQLAQQGDRGAFDALMLKYQGQIIGLAYRMLDNMDEAADIAQEAFFRAYRGLSGFRREAAFRTWLYGITINLVRHKRRWHSRHRTSQTFSITLSEEEGLESSAVEEIPDPAPDPRRRAAVGEANARVSEALGRLPASLRTVVLLRDVNGLPYEEIAQICKENIGTVKSRLHRGRGMLREMLGGMER